MPGIPEHGCMADPIALNVSSRVLRSNLRQGDEE
jgi:hypothetical protein